MAPIFGIVCGVSVVKISSQTHNTGTSVTAALRFAIFAAGFSGNKPELIQFLPWIGAQ